MELLTYWNKAHEVSVKTISHRTVNEVSDDAALSRSEVHSLGPMPATTSSQESPSASGSSAGPSAVVPKGNGRSISAVVQPL